MSGFDDATPRGLIHDTSENLNRRVIARRLLLGVVTILLAGLAGGALYGVVRQWPLAQTLGQWAETAIQAVSGGLTVLTGLTCYWQRPWAMKVRVAWAVSLVVAAGLSGLVWGQPMPLVALAMAVGTLLVALILLWVMGVAGHLRGSAGSPTLDSVSRGRGWFASN